MSNESLATSENEFAEQVLTWFGAHGRKDLPWQQNPTPYRVWISEIMLQQTQVQTVIPYFARFMDRFPQADKLASAPLDEVLHLWTGLGYYARARNLHKTAAIIVDDHGSEFPRDVDSLESLPGIGRSTAGAIAALAMDIRAPILDGNVKRVLTRYFAVPGWPEQSANKKQLWQLADRLTPGKHIASYTQAMMDLGATVCTRSKPLCGHCPLSSNCQAQLSGMVDQYPGKKPKKAKPSKSVFMYVVQNGNGDVLLEKRPANGIWGSLYSFPEVEKDSEGVQESVPNFEIELQEPVRELPRIRHSFTHYDLNITPLQSRYQGQASPIADRKHFIWYPLDGSLEVGLAAPVKKIISQLDRPN